MRHETPVLIPIGELQRAIALIAQPEFNAPYVAFHDYELTQKTLTEGQRALTADLKSVANGTHPMFDQSYVKKQLEKIMKECKEYGVEYENKPMHIVLIELNAKKKAKAL